MQVVDQVIRAGTIILSTETGLNCRLNEPCLGFAASESESASASPALKLPQASLSVQMVLEIRDLEMRSTQHLAAPDILHEVSSFTHVAHELTFMQISSGICLLRNIECPPRCSDHELLHLKVRGKSNLRPLPSSFFFADFMTAADVPSAAAEAHGSKGSSW